MKTKYEQAKKSLKKFRDDRSGSATLETVYAAAMLCMIILTTLFILAYALQIGSATYAARRITRYVEITGQAQQGALNNMLNTLLPNANDIDASVAVINGDWKDAAAGKLNYRGKFTIVIYATYKIPVLQMGDGDPIFLKAPIHVSVSGQSEIFWKK